jgi:hypothetical protein
MNISVAKVIGMAVVMASAEVSHASSKGETLECTFHVRPPSGVLFEEKLISIASLTQSSHLIRRMFTIENEKYEVLIYVDQPTRQFSLYVSSDSGPHFRRYIIAHGLAGPEGIMYGGTDQVDSRGKKSVDLSCTVTEANE